MEKQLQISAKQHNCSTEEAYRILKQALFPIENQKNLGSRLHRQILALTNGVELELPTRSLPRAAPDFSENNKGYCWTPRSFPN